MVAALQTLNITVKSIVFFRSGLQSVLTIPYLTFLVWTISNLAMVKLCTLDCTTFSIEGCSSLYFRGCLKFSPAYTAFVPSSSSILQLTESLFQNVTKGNYKTNFVTKSLQCAWHIGFRTANNGRTKQIFSSVTPKITAAYFNCSNRNKITINTPNTT